MSNTMKLLIVDDSRLIRQTIHDVLRKHYTEEQLNIYHAEDGDIALQAYDVFRPELVLLDIMMPRMNGIEVLQALSPYTASGNVIALMITGMDDDSILSQCFALGARDFIRKPIHEVELISRLEGAMKGYALIRNLHLVNEELLQAKNQMVQAEKMAAIGHLAAGIAHEINNPIGFISSNIATLQNYFAIWKSGDLERFKLFEEDIPDLFSDLNIGIVRIKDIVDSLRNFSRIDNLASTDVFDIEQGIKDTLTVARHRYRYIAEVITHFGSIPHILCNGGKINQVIMNLVVNAADAIKASQEIDGREGKIEIYTNLIESENVILIQVIDNGIGMDSSTVANVFNPFFTTKAVGSGTGLGLSVSYDIIVNEHKGTFEVSSEVNKGTEFKIMLPVIIKGGEYA